MVRMSQAEYDRLMARREWQGKRSGPSKAVEEESQLQRDAEEYLDQIGVWWKHDRDSRKERPGIPDLIICQEGEFVGVELKSREGKVTKEQRDEMAVIRKNGGRTWVARSMDEFREKFSTKANERWPK